VMKAVGPSLKSFNRYLGTAVDAMFEGRRLRADHVARALIRHCVEFQTWRSLVRVGGLTNDEAVEAMLRLAGAAFASPPTTSRRHRTSKRRRS
jgi:hypothetical protein